MVVTMDAAMNFVYDLQLQSLIDGCIAYVLYIAN